MDDCYNANPMSMKASLGVLADAAGRKVAILGDMGELGGEERQLHEEVGRFAAELDIPVFFCVGALCRCMAETIRQLGPGKQVITADTVDEALEALKGVIRAGDTVLVKASHAMHFEKIVEALTKR